MNTTLHIQPSVWNHAMAYANSKGQPLTAIVERYLMSLHVEEVSRQEALDKAQELVGILPRSAKEWKERKAEYLQEKYQ